MQLNIPRYFTGGIISRAISPQFMVARAAQYHRGPLASIWPCHREPITQAPALLMQFAFYSTRGAAAAVAE
jgi:hypothetical protein